MNRDPLHAAVRIASTPALRVILSGPEPLMEALEWHPADEPPDAEMTVLLRIVSPLGRADWTEECLNGYWSGERWCLADDSQIETGATVTHWSDPQGPDA